MNYESNTIGYSNTTTSLAEYLLIVMPDEALTKSLRDFQQALVQQTYPAAELLPLRYLTLAGLLAKDYLEDTVSRWIMKVCRMKPSFALSFNKELIFREGVLSLEISDSAELRSFHQQLGVVDDFLNSSECHPLQLIAKPQLPMLVTDRFISRAENLPYLRAEFLIKEIAMLKRNQFHDRFERINVFGLSR